jgi:hypothetical protein
MSNNHGKREKRYGKKWGFDIAKKRLFDPKKNGKKKQNGD